MQVIIIFVAFFAIKARATAYRFLISELQSLANLSLSEVEFVY